MRHRLLVFLRYPKAGKAKTRLIPEVGAEGAADLAAELAHRALDVARLFADDGSADVSIWYTGCDESCAREIAPGDFTYHEQLGPDLGSRMSAAFEATFNQGYDNAVLIGTDCPELDEYVIDDAFYFLEEADVVLGPADDGGYYLVGLKAPAPGLFQEVPWGSAEVFQTTVNAADRLGLATEALPVLWDVDRPEDLINYELYKTREALQT
jgi:rSAM/selenodomain-associated transferase 1